jgi:hypothetical protein
MSQSISGNCCCGKVEWQAELPPTIVLNCHCTMCRSLSGADYSSWVVLPAAQFRITSGEENISTYQATEKFSRSFCSSCGSTVTCVNNAKFPDHIYVARGNITDEVELPVQLQVYTDDKAAWIDANPDIPVLNP